MSFYRERFGHREGEFPVCEGVAVPEHHGTPARSHETGDGRQSLPSRLVIAS